MRGDTECKNGNFRWSRDFVGIDRRIAAALRAVGEVRGAPFDESSIVLIGYSQGASRAEALARRFPSRYRRVMLVGAPTTPSPSGLESLEAAVMMAGTLDRRSHLRKAAASFSEAGLRAHYFDLPGAHHGEYGPAAEDTMTDALGWLLAPKAADERSMDTSSPGAPWPGSPAVPDR
jgi:pimeloyl-ACP methyl ester carboxylesterase